MIPDPQRQELAAVIAQLRNKEGRTRNKLLRAAINVLWSWMTEDQKTAAIRDLRKSL